MISKINLRNIQAGLTRKTSNTWVGLQSKTGFNENCGRVEIGQNMEK